MIALLYSNSAVAVMNKTLVFLFYSLISVPMVHANNLSDGWFIGVSGNSFNRDISIVDTESGKEMQDTEGSPHNFPKAQPCLNRF